ncbi:MAG: TonB-dependent receptor plug domain-containing protein [Acidobacteriota bacterium]
MTRDRPTADRLDITVRRHLTRRASLHQPSSSPHSPIDSPTLARTRSRSTPLLRAVLSCIVALWIAGALPAQQSSAPDARDSATRRVLLPEEFARFVPRNALDMVRQIPGFSVREGGEERGLGQVDTNILINGRRISGKSNGPVDALQRIPAGDVVRLEIVDGASLDLAGLSGQVLNVITRSDRKVSGQYRWAPQMRDYGASTRWGELEISLSGSGERSEWTLGLANEQQRFGGRGPERVFDGDGLLVERRFERRFEEFDVPSLSGSFTRESERGNVFNFTGALQGFLYSQREFSDQSGPGPGDPLLRSRSLSQSEDEVSYELGFDYEMALGPGRLKWIGLHRFEYSPSEDSVRFDFADDRPATETVFEREADEYETILRTEYTFALWGGDAQLSLEAVRNVVDLESELAERDAEGVLQPISFRGSSSRIEEERDEATLSFSRELTPRLQLQASVGAEYSRLEQIGELGLVRDFVRPKGLLSLDWKAGSQLDVSTKIERQVGQLDFFDFAANVNLNQEQVNVSNVNLVPPQSWLLETELNQGLGAAGSATLRLFAEEIDDIVDQIPIEGSGEAPGNIDSAERYGATLDLTLLSDPFAWRGGRFDVRFTLIDSEVIDPLLGVPRRISGTDNFSLNSELRQDFFGTDWASGMRIFYEEDSARIRLDQTTLARESFTFADLYLEHKDVRGLTIRGSLGNVFDRQNRFFRTIFNDRATGDIAFREERFRRFGPVYTLSIQGSF